MVSKPVDKEKPCTEDLFFLAFIHWPKDCGLTEAHECAAV